MASPYEALLMEQVAYLMHNSPVLLQSTTLGSNQSSVVLNVPSGIAYNTLRVNWRTRCDNAVSAQQMYLQFNGDTGSNYLVERSETNNTTTTNVGPGGAATTKIQIGTVSCASATALYFSSGSFTVGGASDAVNFKTAVGTGTAYATVSNAYIGLYGGQWNSAATITSLTLTPAAGNFVAGSVFSLFGEG